MPIVPQVYCSCGPHDAKCFCRFIVVILSLNLYFLSLSTPPAKSNRPAPPLPPRGAGRLDFALGGLRNSLKSSDYIKFDLNCHFLYFSVKKYLFLKKNNFTKILIAILIFKLLPFRFLQCIVHVFEHLFHAFKRFCYA
jgi:hypothetical protein